MVEQNIIEIPHTELLENVLQLKKDGYRLVQMCSTKTETGFELSYSFATFDDFKHLRMQISEDTEISSISDIFTPAFLYENEMNDLFGIKIKNIILDYQGKLYRINAETPFNPKQQ